MLKRTVTTLDSGLVVIQIPMPSVKSATVLALSNTGSRYEPPKAWGVAHFLEHMVFKGTAKYPTAQNLAASIDAVGADFNAFTSKEYTGYYVKADSAHVGLALDVVSDMLLTPKLLKKDIEREKGVIIEELNMYADNPARHINNLFEEMAYSQPGLSHNIIGTKETISQMKKQDFEKLLTEWYELGNLVVIVAGDEKIVNSKKLLTQIETAFSKQKTYSKSTSKSRTTKKDIKKFFSKKPFSNRKLHLEHKKTEQAHFVLGWPAHHRLHPDRYVNAVFMTILGGNMSSRLFTEVREKRGLGYYIHSSTDQYHDTGLIGASAGVDPQRVDEALQVTIEEFTKVVAGQKGAITSDELKRAKDYVAGKLVLGLEDSESVAQFFGLKQLLQNTTETPEEVLAKYKAVTLDDIHRVAEELIKPGELRLALIGDFKDEDRFLKIIEASA